MAQLDMNEFFGQPAQKNDAKVQLGAATGKKSNKELKQKAPAENQPVTDATASCISHFIVFIRLEVTG